jgi:hypothetical protein
LTEPLTSHSDPKYNMASPPATNNVLNIKES